MKTSRFRKFAGVFILACLCQLSALRAGVAAAGTPTFEQVVAATSAYFQTLPDYQPNDLMRRSDVAGALAAIAQVGWEVPFPEKIEGLALADDSFLVTELATPDGKAFMRKISRNRGAYGRLDRLSQIKDGEEAVEILINDPGGDMMITYMTTTPGGHELGKMMAGTPNGTNLNKPTAHIYTADELIALLKKIYEIEFASAPIGSP